jgi:hypothetical protein
MMYNENHAVRLVRVVTRHQEWKRQAPEVAQYDAERPMQCCDKTNKNAVHREIDEGIFPCKQELRC